MHVCILTHIRRVDADIKCLPRLLHILSFETGSLIQLGAAGVLGNVLVSIPPIQC